MRVQYIIVGFVLMLFVLFILLTLMGYIQPNWNFILNILKTKTEGV